MSWVKMPLLCKLGFHTWFLDAAFFYSVDKCNRCPKARDKKKAELLEYERMLWEQESTTSFEESAMKVASKLFNP